MIGRAVATATLCLGLSAGAASAATVYAQAVTGYDTNGSATSCAIGDAGFSTSTSRANLCNALGEPDHPGGGVEGKFLSAGNYAALKFTFGGPITGPIEIYEITFGRNKSWQETLGLAFVLMGSDGAAFGSILPTAQVVNSDGTEGATDDTFKLSFGTAASIGVIKELWVFDLTPKNTAAGKGGGFDIDAIGAVSVVPLPAAAGLLLAGLGGLAMVRRRKG
ncbi:VPLPA-CTERM sorting domain-containing protein [Palleronia sp. KMU-117]|uniref:VPLPA-CTERM sorting domain-containing protein n=1 Tax=Palleronia sp. KMU-117 TaxID=3434108 RepID=UPI003D73CB68